jgi:hypothetical protein
MEIKESIGTQLLYTILINWEGGLHPKTNYKKPKGKFKHWPLGILEHIEVSPKLDILYRL